MRNPLPVLPEAAGFSALAFLTFYLITDWQHCFVFTEPRIWIRLPEIAVGIYAGIALLRKALA